MKLYELFGQSELESQISLKMVKATAHPKLPLTILNYTQQATFTPEHWNHVTDLCRGIVYETESLEVVARPFCKFWNLGDLRHPETAPENLPTALPTITRKMDGSLGIAYPTPQGWSIATRGSFASDQALWASRWLHAHPIKMWRDGYTPLFEIIYPENQIVVKYNWSGLMLLALVKISTGEEASRAQLWQFAEENGFDVVSAFDKPLDSLAAEDTANEEGYVLAWDRPGTYPLRCKVKYATYCRLHKLLTQTNAVTVWEMLRDKQDISTLTADVPVEFKAWLESVRIRLQGEYARIESQAKSCWDGYSGPDPKQDRKSFALYATQQKSVAPILFAMLDGKDYAPIIWKMCRPDGAKEKAFKVDAES